MAQVTIQFAAFRSGQEVVSLRYNDANYTVNRLTIANSSTQTAYCYADKVGYPRQELPCPAGQTVNQVTAALQIGWDAANQCLDWTDIVFGARFPE